jgi:hypothetical protein
VDHLVKEAGEVHRLGVPAVVLFGIPASKDETGSQAWAADGVVPRAIAALKERIALLEDELRVVRGGADERLVLDDRLVELALRLQDADHLEPQIDVLRVDRERLLVRVQRLAGVARLLIEGAEEGEALEVARVLVLDLLDQDGQLLIGTIDLGDGLVDLGADRGFLSGRGERLLEGGERLGVLVGLRLRLAEVLERGRERAVVARRGAAPGRGTRRGRRASRR